MTPRPGPRKRRRARGATRQELADLLGVNLRTLQKRLAVGMPEPAKGEEPAAWAVRANRWLDETRQPVGRRPTPAREERERLELAILEEKLTKLRLDNKWQSGDMVSRAEREGEEQETYEGVREMLLELPGRMVRQLCLRREAEAILAAEVREILAELSAAHQDLCPADDDDEPADDEPDDEPPPDPTRIEFEHVQEAAGANPATTEASTAGTSPTPSNSAQPGVRPRETTHITQ